MAPLVREIFPNADLRVGRVRRSALRPRPQLGSAGRGVRFGHSQNSRNFSSRQGAGVGAQVLSARAGAGTPKAAAFTAAQIGAASGHRTAQEGRKIVRRAPVTSLSLPATQGPETATGSPGRTLPPQARAVPSHGDRWRCPCWAAPCPEQRPRGWRHTRPSSMPGRVPFLTIQAGGAGRPVPCSLPSMRGTGTAQEGQGAVRRPLPCPCPCPPRRAQRRPQEAQAMPSHHPGQGGALPWGSAAVPLLGGSMPRAAAPRMAAHRPSSTPGKAYPIPHPKKV